MTDVLIYWRDYQKNAAAHFAGWHSNSRLLGNLQPGDRLWMVTAGRNLGQEAEQAGFLVAIWQVKQAVPNPSDDPAYPSEKYRYRVVADHEHSTSFAQPVPVDHILRPIGRDRAVSIGTFLQGPRKINGEKFRQLRAAAGPDLAIQWLRKKDER